jgi:hypothetical protein
MALLAATENPYETKLAGVYSTVLKYTHKCKHYLHVIVNTHCQENTE